MNEEKCRLTIGIIRRKNPRRGVRLGKLSGRWYRPVRNEVLFYLLTCHGIDLLPEEDEDLAVTEEFGGNA